MKDVISKASSSRERIKNRKALLRELALDYASNTTLHGMRYIADKTLTVVERLFWLLTFILSIALCFLLIRAVWIKWQTSPVIVSFSEKFVPVEMVPFPSITICPETKIRPSVYNFTSNYETYVKNLKRTNLTEDEKAARIKLQDISLICQLPNIMTHVKTGRTATNSSIIEIFKEVQPSIEDSMFSCVWRDDESINCSELFSTVITDKGVCFNFNSLSTNEVLNMQNIHNDFNYSDVVTPSDGWSLSEGYSIKANAYPRRGMSSTKIEDLTIVFKLFEKDNDRLCNLIDEGFTIFLQHPGDHPQTSQHYFAALPNRITSVGLKVNMITTADSLKDYSPKARQCYFPTERKLKYFKIYTASNCMLECYTNLTQELCGCVEFYMPYNDSESICTSEQQTCVDLARENISERLINQFIDEKSDPCSCLPACDSIEYDGVDIITDYDYRRIINYIAYVEDRNLSEHVDNVQYSVLNFYFKEPRFISIRRSELFGVSDLLASCGGILGLCLGFSFLSLIEIIYFFTLRCGLLLKKDWNEEKKSLKSTTSKDESGVEICRM
ncbi:pickpocket protein 28-like [Aphomia sociella]